MAGTPMALLVGLDGVRCDIVRELELPHIRSLAARGFLAETRMPDTEVARSETAPGWSTILTGVWPTKHLVTTNHPEPDTPTALDRYPDVLNRLETQTPPLRTLAATGAAMLAGDLGHGPILGPDITELIFHDRRLLPKQIFEADRKVLHDVLERLPITEARLSFVYFGSTDKTAHRHGARTAAYADAIRVADERLGLLLAAIEARPSYGAEDWLVMVTTDHGHLDEGGHGGNTWQERQSFVVAAGNGITSSPVRNAVGNPVRNVDIAPTLLTHFGVPIDPAWELDGRPLQR